MDYNFDLTSGRNLPFEDKAAKLFYSEHTFEHLYDEAIKVILKEAYRCLKDGGGIRLVVPDIDLAISAYKIQDMKFLTYVFPKEDKTLEEKFLNYFATYLKDKVDSNELRYNFEKMGKSELLDFYSKQIDPLTRNEFPGNHINWFDYSKLMKMLEEAGFKRIYRSTPQGSKFKEKCGKEFDIRPSWSLYVEAIK